MGRIRVFSPSVISPGSSVLRGRITVPSLYVVATPIGNLEDISLRALRTLREVGLIAAEDTRRTRKLLSAYDVKTPLTSYFEHNKQKKLPSILDKLKEADVAVVSDAGTPGLSDPGYELISAAITAGISVISIPGPAVVTTAMVVSGLPLYPSHFIGFLPSRGPARRRALAEISAWPGTIIVLEAPHRLRAALADMITVLGDRYIAVCRELTKLHEEVFRGQMSQALGHFEKPRGEFTLVIAGRPPAEKPVLNEEIRQRLLQQYQSGQSAKSAIAELNIETGLSKRELYQAWLEIKDPKQDD